jgi:hypothetical protein
MKQIPNYIDYKVSNTGVVYSFKRGSAKVMKLTKDKYGYLRVGLTKDGKEKKFRVHQLVASAFLNHKIDGHKVCVDHINNIKSDNRVENLQLLSNRDNINKSIKSKHKGVGYYKNLNKFRARAMVNGKHIHIGYYSSQKEATDAYSNFTENL